MGEGWETRRRRDDGNDWVVIELGAAGVPERVEIDTTHFKYNASGEFALWSCLCDVVPDPLAGPWEPLLPRAPLQPDTRHVFAVPQAVPATHLRLDAFPDGGIARLHVHGQVSPAAIEAAELRWRATSPDRTA
jgi:allantoicase